MTAGKGRRSIPRRRITTEDKNMPTTTTIPELEILEDCVLWDGDQIAAFISPGELCLSISDEDLENGEVSIPKRKEIWAAEEAITRELSRLGIRIVEDSRDPWPSP
jgi:hypothetical protein